MPQAQPIDIRFPLAGKALRMGFQNQEPFTTPGPMTNAWPRDALQGQMRGGSRPGLVKAIPTQMASPIHLLANVRVIEDSGLQTFADQFNVSDFGRTTDIWDPATWLPDRPLVNNGWAFVYDGIGFTNDAGVVLKRLGIDTSSQYEILIVPLPNVLLSLEPHPTIEGDYWIFARMADSNPNVETSGVAALIRLRNADIQVVVLQNDNDELAFIIIRDTYLNTSNLKFSLRIDSSNTATVLINGDVILDSIAISSAAGERVGFRINGAVRSRVPSNVHLRRIDYFQVDYTSTVTLPNRNVVVAVGGTNASLSHSGEMDLRYEDTPNALVAPSVSGIDPLFVMQNAAGRHLQAVELLGILYIVGENTFIQQFDPKGVGSLVSLKDSVQSDYPFVSGTVPSNCTAIASWRQRLCVVSENDPQNVSMSRSGVPGNWSYAAIPVGSAVKLNTTGIDSGKTAEPINAIIAHSDDYLLLGCLNSLWVLRGDPTLGGLIDRLSDTIGIVAPQAWARGPNGETVFLSRDGLYALPAGVLAFPESVSRERLPNELRDIDTRNFRILMAYDVRNRGVFIGQTPLLGGGGKYFWFDWETRGFFPMEFDPSFEPTALVYRNADSPLEQRLMFGCRDGHIRAMDDLAINDDGVNFPSNVLIGPIALGGGGYYDGMLREVIGQLGAGSGDITCEVLIGNSIEAARNATPRSATTFRSGKNLTHRPQLRGNACFLRLSSPGGLAWALENLTIVRERLGKQRL